MGDTKGRYNPEYPVGSKVRIADRIFLEQFIEEWNLHNPLQPTQLQFAGMDVVVSNVSFYHGGYELYELVDVPGVWHERCLKSID
jgi:hypothetical protein